MLAPQGIPERTPGPTRPRPDGRAGGRLGAASTVRLPFLHDAHGPGRESPEPGASAPHRQQ